MRKYLVAATFAGVLASPAFAQTAPGPFTGFRLEGLAGYDSLRSGQDDDGVDTNDNEGDESLDGVVFGIGGGYDFDAGGVVLGVEGEFTESTGEQSADESIDLPFRSKVETGRDIYVGGRVGVAVAPTTLVYAKGGYSNTSIEAAFEDDTDRFEFDTNVDGYRVGAGIEQLFGERAYGKVEYRYSNYSNLDFAGDEGDFETSTDLDRHQVMAGVGIRF